MDPVDDKVSDQRKPAAKAEPVSEVAFVRSLLERDIRNSVVHRIPSFSSKRKSIDDRASEAKVRKEEAEADDAEGDIKLKKLIAYVIIGVLIVQTLIIFVISISQGVGYFPLYPNPSVFNLTEWNFRTLIAGTLIETYFLMRIVVAYLFPNNRKSKEQ